jgi:hypothetical protein
VLVGIDRLLYQSMAEQNANLLQVEIIVKHFCLR